MPKGRKSLEHHSDSETGGIGIGAPRPQASSSTSPEFTTSEKVKSGHVERKSTRGQRFSNEASTAKACGDDDEEDTSTSGTAATCDDFEAHASPSSPQSMHQGMGEWQTLAFQTEAGEWQTLADPKVDLSDYITVKVPVNQFYSCLQVAGDVHGEWRGVTTVIVKNIPTAILQQKFVDDLIANGFEGTYDYVNVPLNRKTRRSRGYAFINFIDPSFAWNYKCCYDGVSTATAQGMTGKHLSVMPATLQGKDANYVHYIKSRSPVQEDPSDGPLFLNNSTLIYL